MEVLMGAILGAVWVWLWQIHSVLLDIRSELKRLNKS